MVDVPWNQTNQILGESWKTHWHNKNSMRKNENQNISWNKIKNYFHEFLLTLFCSLLAKTIPDADYADYLVLLANIPVQADYVRNSLEDSVRGASLYVNSDKAEFICFNQGGAISPLNDKLQKLVEFIYLGSNISSTESNINICVSKAYTLIETYGNLISLIK